MGEYTTEGFVVLMGSNGRVENAASIHGTSNVQIRESLDELKRKTVSVVH